MWRRTEWTGARYDAYAPRLACCRVAGHSLAFPRVVAVDEMVVVERLAELAELAGVGVEIPLRIAHGGNVTNSNGTAHGLSERKPGRATLALCHLASTDEKQQ